MAYTDRSSGCWLWLASKDKDGYGLLRSRQVKRRAHVVAYTMRFGPVPRGLELDHTCRNRACVNPAHLEAVTHAENVRRGAQTWQGTHCKRGHELTPENVYVNVKAGKRQCLVCRRRKPTGSLLGLASVALLVLR